MSDKLDIEDNMEDFIVKLSEGNPGAVTALTEVLNEKGSEDFVLVAMNLDMASIYGSEIWRLFKEYCDKDVSKFQEAVLHDTEEIMEFLSD